MNTITLSGRLTKAIRSNTVNNTPVVNFTAAVELGLKSQVIDVNGKQVLAQVPATSYIDCAAWGTDAADASHLEAGQEVTFTLTSLGSKGRKYENKVLADVIARVNAVQAGAKAKARISATA